MNAIELAQQGLNRSCVDCGDSPLFGGMRCLRCFQTVAAERAGVHEFAEPPSHATYSAGCRCRACRQQSASYQRRRRKGKAAKVTRIVTSHSCLKHPEPVHVCYIKHGCRCLDCRRIHSDYDKAYRRNKAG